MAIKPHNRGASQHRREHKAHPPAQASPQYSKRDGSLNFNPNSAAVRGSGAAVG